MAAGKEQVQVAEHQNSIALQFNFKSKHRDTIKILQNFINNALSRTSNEERVGTYLAEAHTVIRDKKKMKQAKIPIRMSGDAEGLAKVQSTSDLNASSALLSGGKFRKANKFENIEPSVRSSQRREQLGNIFYQGTTESPDSSDEEFARFKGQAVNDEKAVYPRSGHQQRSQIRFKQQNEEHSERQDRQTYDRRTGRDSAERSNDITQNQSIEFPYQQSAAFAPPSASSR